MTAENALAEALPHGAVDEDGVLSDAGRERVRREYAQEILAALHDAGWTLVRQDADLLERFDSLIAYVETWPDGGNSDGFADTLRAARSALRGDDR